ncbi:MAG: tyrosine-type recombinase/integrase [Pseudomonadales bacterium]|nr:tyrosine-type recombinase/integrase [Pseudomonadales bacterium]
MNLYTANNGTSYRYQHPVSGKQFGMGNNKEEAINAAKQLNSLLIPGNDLVSNVLGYVSLEEHIEWMRKNNLPEREYSKSTQVSTEIQYRNLITAFGDRNIEEITTLNIAGLLENLTPSVSKSLRQVSTDVFRIAISRGLCRDNPAEYTLIKKQVTQRQRLTQAQFQAIHRNAPVWLQNAMDLAYITLQRRSDIVAMKFSDIKEGYLYVVQQKTKKYDTGYLKIQMSDSLERLSKRCQDSTASPFIIHRRPARIAKREELEHWTQITPDYVTRVFQKVRNSLDEFKKMPSQHRPTFHEIRALGIKNMIDVGANPQSLAGHSSEQMTNNYDSGHDEIRWTETAIILDILDKTSS